MEQSTPTTRNTEASDLELREWGNGTVFMDSENPKNAYIVDEDDISVNIEDWV